MDSGQEQIDGLGSRHHRETAEQRAILDALHDIIKQLLSSSQLEDLHRESTESNDKFVILACQSILRRIILDTDSEVVKNVKDLLERSEVLGKFERQGGTFIDTAAILMAKLCDPYGGFQEPPTEKINIKSWWTEADFKKGSHADSLLHGQPLSNQSSQSPFLGLPMELLEMISSLLDDADSRTLGQTCHLLYQSWKQRLSCKEMKVRNTAFDYAHAAAILRANFKVGLLRIDVGHVLEHEWGKLSGLDPSRTVKSSAKRFDAAGAVLEQHDFYVEKSGMRQDLVINALRDDKVKMVILECQDDIPVDQDFCSDLATRSKADRSLCLEKLRFDFEERQVSEPLLHRPLHSKFKINPLGIKFKVFLRIEFPLWPAKQYLHVPVTYEVTDLFKALSKRTARRLLGKEIRSVLLRPESEPIGGGYALDREYNGNVWRLLLDHATGIGGERRREVVAEVGL